VPSAFITYTSLAGASGPRYVRRVKRIVLPSGECSYAKSAAFGSALRASSVRRSAPSSRTAQRLVPHW
jgi:hypothetical protein